MTALRMMPTHATLPPPHRAGPMIAVASGKGGVGKTWLSITLAHALARRGRRVLLFDADLGLANVDVQMGLTPPLDIGHVVAGEVGLADAVLHHAPGAFDVLAGRSGSGALSTLDATGLDRVLDALRQIAGRYDAVLLDLGAGLDRTTRRMASWADTLLVVATEEPTSLTDAYATLKLTYTDSLRPVDARVVVNQTTTPAAAQRTFATLERACTAFLGRAPVLAGTVRRDPRVPDSIRRQAMLLSHYPGSAAGQDVDRLAEHLI